MQYMQLSTVQVITGSLEKNEINTGNTLFGCRTSVASGDSDCAAVTAPRTLTHRCEMLLQKLFGVRVHFHVPLDAATLRETAAADGARMRLHAEVRQQVPPKVRALRKAAAARRADDGPQARVRPHVTSQRPNVRDPQAAVRTQDGFAPVCVREWIAS